MKSKIYLSEDRGKANHGWLEARHTFSFANYYNPEKTNFGMLRVFNDDLISGESGFGKHPHDNMEIISYIVKGELSHEDSMGNKGVIKEDEIQVMSAGTGVFHSEYNSSRDQTNLLQIWIFPNKNNVTPRYDQKSLKDFIKPNTLTNIISPKGDESSLWIHQDAWMYVGDYQNPQEVNYQLKNPDHGVFVFLIDGQLSIDENTINRRDSIGVWATPHVEIQIKEKSKFLLIEIPMINK